MRGINQVFILGHVGHEPEPRRTQSGRIVVELRIATQRAIKQEEGWGQVADWHTVRFWEQQAEVVAKYVHKGSLIGVEGSLRYEQWTDSHEQKRTSTVIQGDRLHLVSTGPRAERGAEGEGTPAVTHRKLTPVPEEEIPF